MMDIEIYMYFKVDIAALDRTVYSLYAEPGLPASVASDTSCTDFCLFSLFLTPFLSDRENISKTNTDFYCLFYEYESSFTGSFMPINLLINRIL